MHLLSSLLSTMLLLVGLGTVAAIAGFSHYTKELPEYAYLKDYQPPTLSRIYADDGRMMAVVATEQRLFVPIDAIPKQVIDAFLSAEDTGFYAHDGIDYVGILRAVLVNIQNIGRDRHPMGASTITQQVAKNMLLTNEVSVSRKIREAILASRLEKTLSKRRILEIYLNEIYLGNRSYGIAAAALNYFGKALDELSLSEAAFLAALPKGPNNYNPVRFYDAAVGRRNWVLSRMAETGRISAEESVAAQQDLLKTRPRDRKETMVADYFSEDVRRQLVDMFGEELVLEGGLAVKTSLDPKLQAAAEQALRSGLITFDRRNRGWRGAVAHFDDLSDWERKLAATPVPAGAEDWQKALVTGLKKNEVQISFLEKTAEGVGVVKGILPWPEMRWARKEISHNKFGPAIRTPADVLRVGDVIMVEAVRANEDGESYPERTYTLRQVPVVQGGIVALDPHTGRVFAMTGGFSTKISQFNRATQAMRQPGSAFKPFIYMAALANGFTPASLISDSPAEYFQGPRLPMWRPENYDGADHGPLPLRQGIEKSQNVMTVRLANAIGMPLVVEYAKKFGIADDMPELLSFSLGAKETTLLRMATAYGMIVNGGKKVSPTLIDRVQDRDGKTIWRADSRDCVGCRAGEGWADDLFPPNLPDIREQIEDPRTAYQMVSFLQGAIQRGTARRLSGIDFPLAGKTGTTNDSKDAWFIGFTPDLVCGVYIGFDAPTPLGSRETGASVAVPIFRDFIVEAIKDKPPIPFRVPPGLRMVRINPLTGDLVPPSDRTAIWEAFIPGTELQEGQLRPILDDNAEGFFNAGGAGTPAAEQEDPSSLSVAPLRPEALSLPPGFSSVQPEPPEPPPATAGTGGLY